ncbi:MAG: hypothetical protein ACJZ67_05670 [Candidatus Thalassarchaeaceae archaeon]
MQQDQIKESQHKPYLLKLSPDALDDEIRSTISFAQKLDIDGIVATNTTIKRPIPLSTQSRKAFSSDGRSFWSTIAVKGIRSNLHGIR